VRRSSPAFGSLNFTILVVVITVVLGVVVAVQQLPL
jgi:hypothetical protein